MSESIKETVIYAPSRFHQKVPCKRNIHVPVLIIRSCLLVEAPSAAQFKTEGDKLYASKDYVAAHLKYTKAIAKDECNAVLYCNRAACSFNMRM